MSVIRPLELERELTRPRYYLDIAPLFDVLLIALMFMLLGSHYIFAPGMSISLPVAPQRELPGLPAMQVLTIKNNNFLLFDGIRFTLQEFSKYMRNYKFEEIEGGPSVLLVRADENVDIQTFLWVSEMAHDVGFSIIQLAAEPASTYTRKHSVLQAK